MYDRKRCEIHGLGRLSGAAARCVLSDSSISFLAWVWDCRASRLRWLAPILGSGIHAHCCLISVTLPNPGKLTIFDTPGHAAFSMMRARGVSMVDVSVLVIAADDGIMPQTLESIRMANRAKVPIVIAITKCDLPNAKPELVRQQLMRHGMFSDDSGGDVQVCDVFIVSASVNTFRVFDLRLSVPLDTQTMWRGDHCHCQHSPLPPLSLLFPPCHCCCQH